MARGGGASSGMMGHHGLYSSDECAELPLPSGAGGASGLASIGAGAERGLAETGVPPSSF